jgi:hypothetical protein
MNSQDNDDMFFDEDDHQRDIQRHVPTKLQAQTTQNAKYRVD